MTKIVVSIGAFLVFFGAFSHSGVYFSIPFKSSTPLDIVSYYVIAAQKLSTFLLSTSMQLSGALLFLNNYDVTKVKIKTAELWFSSFMWSENKQYCKKKYQWRLLKCKFMGTPFHVMESWATAGP